MNLMNGVYEWNFIQWILLIAIIVFVTLWVTGNNKLVDHEERICRIESLDEYYEYPGGFLIMHVRNLLFTLFLILLFNILSF